MPQKRLFGHDPLTGITQYWHVTDKGEYVIETQQDVTSIAEANKRQYNDTPDKHSDTEYLGQGRARCEHYNLFRAKDCGR